jgi:nitrogen fixation NifU-like protein
MIDELQQEISQQERALYSDVLLRESSSPKNVGPMADADAHGVVHGWCGDTMEIYLKLDDVMIEQATFVTDGCGATLACGSMLTQMVTGMAVEEAEWVLPDDLVDALDGLPEENMHCAGLAVSTLQNALFNWRMSEMDEPPGAREEELLLVNSVEPPAVSEVEPPAVSEVEPPTGAGAGISDYMAWLRTNVGHDLLLVPAAIARIQDDQGRVLLLERSDGDDLWGFPGGAIEPGESAVAAVKREVSEETGLQVEPVGLIGVYSAPGYAFAYPNGDRVQPVGIFFDCRVLSGELTPDGQEVTGARYFAPDELPQMRPCCVAKARDAFAFDGRSFMR